MTSCRKALFSLYALSLFTSMAGMEIFAWSLFLFGLVELIRMRDFSSLSLGIDPIIWAFVLIVAASLAIHVDSFQGFMEYFGDMRWVFLLYTFAYLLKKSTKIPESSLIWCLVIGLIVACSYSVFQFTTGLNPSSSHRILDPVGNFFRATGFFSMPLTFGYSVGMGGLLLLGIGRNQTGKIKNVLYAAVLLSVAGIFVSITRGAWVSAVICFLGFGFMQFGWRKIWKFVVAFLVIATLGISLNSTLRERVVSIGDRGNHSNSLRLTIWRANLEMVKENPILGMGFGQNKKALPEYYQKIGVTEEFTGHAHSNYIQMLAGTGFLGLFCYLFISFYFLRVAFQLWRSGGKYSGLGLGSFWAQMYMHIGGLTECNFTDGEVTHLVILCWALVAAASFKQRSIQS